MFRRHAVVVRDRLARSSIGLIVGYHAKAGRSLYLSIALGLLLGGALGNLLDRLRLGYVVDFVDIGIGDLRFYTFNLADAAISTAIVMLIGGGALPGLDRLAREAVGWLTRRYAPGVRVLRVPDGLGGRVDRYVADATGLSRSYVQKLISDGRLTTGGERRSRRTRSSARGRSCGSTCPRRSRSTSTPAPEIPLPDRLRGRRPADPRQAGRARRPPVARACRRHAGQRAAGARRRVDLGRHRRRPAAGHRPPPRPRHERAADGRAPRRGAGLDHGPAQGAPGQEDLPGARPGERRRPRSGGSRRRSAATRSTARGWPSSRTGGRR